MLLPNTRYRYRALDATLLIGSDFEARIYRTLSKKLLARKKIHRRAGAGARNLALQACGRRPYTPTGCSGQIALRRNTIRVDVELCNYLSSPIFGAWPTVFDCVLFDPAFAKSACVQGSVGATLEWLRGTRSKVKSNDDVGATLIPAARWRPRFGSCDRTRHSAGADLPRRTECLSRRRSAR